MIKIKDYRQLYSLGLSELAAMCKVFDKDGNPCPLSKQALAYREKNEWLMARIGEDFHFSNPKEKRQIYISRVIDKEGVEL